MTQTNARSVGPDAPTPSVAIAVPCHDEAAAIPSVVASWRSALPDAELVIFDNASTDGTGELARSLGVRVVEVPELGKGNAIRAAFRTLAEYDILVLNDGDGTYPAELAGRLIAPVAEGRADMVVGARRPIAEGGAMSPVRGTGNALIRAAFRLLIGRSSGDLLSGYRAFSRGYRERIEPRSSGFEIETELSCEAITHGMRVVEVEVPYYPRIEGTVSKLRAFRDGRRILSMIIAESARHRPWRLAALLLGPLAILLVLLRAGIAR